MKYTVEMHSDFCLTNLHSIDILFMILSKVLDPRLPGKISRADVFLCMKTRYNSVIHQEYRKYSCKGTLYSKGEKQ